MKKFIAKLSAVALLAALVVVPELQAAAINDATATVAGPAVGQDITVTSTGNFPNGDEIASATVKNLDGTAAGATTLTLGGDNANDDTSVLTIAGAPLLDNTAYILSFSTTSGDFGSIQINVGTPANTQVTVTATVEPTLTFALNTYAIALGTLVADTTSTGTVVATTGTNAQGGLVMKVASLGLSSHANYIGGFGVGTATTGADTYKIESTTDASGDVLASTDVTADQTILTADSLTEANAVTTVNVGATSVATTEAGEYEDTLTFSVTATF